MRSRLKIKGVVRPAPRPSCRGRTRPFDFRAQRSALTAGGVSPGSKEERLHGPKARSFQRREAALMGLRHTRKPVAHVVSLLRAPAARGMDAGWPGRYSARFTTARSCAAPAAQGAPVFFKLSCKTKLFLSFGIIQSTFDSGKNDTGTRGHNFGREPPGRLVGCQSRPRALIRGGVVWKRGSSLSSLRR